LGFFRAKFHSKIPYSVEKIDCGNLAVRLL
jgi:hypothetical protein